MCVRFSETVYSENDFTSLCLHRDRTPALNLHAKSNMLQVEAFIVESHYLLIENPNYNNT